jgi:hypothetical protein
MRKNLILVIFLMSLVLVWSVWAGALKRDMVGTNKSGMALGPEQFGEDELPLEQRYCWIQNSPWIAYSYYYFTGWLVGDGYGIWVNPGVYSGCADPVAYPFLVRAARIYARNYTGVVWPVNVDLKVYLPNDPYDSCAGPNLSAQVCSQTFSLPSGNAAYILTYAVPCCVTGPFYMMLEYNDPTAPFYPSMYVSNASNGPPPDPTKPCANWMRDGVTATWYELQAYFQDPLNFGNLYFRCYGEAQSPVCEGTPVFGITTTSSPSESVSVIQACAGDIIRVPNVTLGSYNGYTGNVTLSFSNLPTDVDSAWFVPPVVTVDLVEPGISDGFIATQPDLAPGYYYIDITGTDGVLTRSTYLWIRIKPNDFSTAVTALNEVKASGSGVVVDVVTALCFNFPVTLTVTGLPAGCTYLVSPNGVIPSTTGTNFNITVNADASTVPGFYPITITATGSDPGATVHLEYFTLWVHPSNYCTIFRHYRFYYGFYGIGQNEASANWYIPDQFCTPLPLRVVDATWWYYYATNRHVLPTTMKVVLWNTASCDSCWGPGAVLGESDPLVKSTAVVGFGVEPVFLTFSSAVCVDSPFFAGIKYVSCAPDSCLGFGTDGYIPTDTCATWYYDNLLTAYPDSFEWYEGIYYMGDNTVGYLNLKLGVLTYPNGCICGEVTGDGIIDIEDIVYLINYAFYDGPAPDYPSVADVTGDGIIDIEDIVFLINYAFYGGAAPTDCIF